MTFADYFAMGGYGGFVWPAYGLAAIVFIGLAWVSFASARTQARLLEKLKAQSPHRKRRAQAAAGEEGNDGF
jgi:heme exporter protein D